MMRRSKSGNSRDFCSFLETFRRDAVPCVNFPIQCIPTPICTHGNRIKQNVGKARRSKGPFTRASTFASACAFASNCNMFMRMLRQTQRMGSTPILCIWPNVLIDTKLSSWRKHTRRRKRWCSCEWTLTIHSLYSFGKTCCRYIFLLWEGKQLVKKLQNNQALTKFLSEIGINQRETCFPIIVVHG